MSSNSVAINDLKMTNNLLVIGFIFLAIFFSITICIIILYVRMQLIINLGLRNNFI